MILVDTHCHLDFDAFDGDRDEIVARSREDGVVAVVVPALDLGNVKSVISLTEQYEDVYAAIGVHPNSTSDWDDLWLTEIRNAAAQRKVVAIGEIGLDYYWDKAPESVQQRAFAQQLELAAELDLPVIVHNREASDDVMAALTASALAGRERPGVLHSFSGDWPMAQRAIELGFYIGFTGPVTFKKAEELRQIAALVPLARILIETDAPFLTPHPYRGKRNEPAYVRYVAEAIAAVRGLEADEVAMATTDNAIRLFGLPTTATNAGPPLFPVQ